MITTIRTESKPKRELRLMVAKRRRYEQACEQCAKMYHPHRRSQKYCSTGCRGAAGRLAAVRPCEQCGAPFRPQGQRLGKGRYCSKACVAEAKKPTPSACNACGADIPGPNKKYCSAKCYRGADPIAGPNTVCANCGKDVKRAPSEMRKYDHHYCSLACFRKGSYALGAPRRKPGSKWGMSGTRAGKREDLGIYVRSTWEANYARYLKWLEEKGEISGWRYEPETFWFESIKRGTRSYTPDFRVDLLSGAVEYHEVKGWNHPKGATALRRMAKYHPKIKIVLIDTKRYRALERSVGKLVPLWE